MQILAADLILLKRDGTQQLQDVAIIGKWVFVEKNLQLLDKAGNLLAMELISNIKKITFSLTDGSAVENVPTNSIVVYPNPTQDVLMVQGIESQTLRVYDLQGRLLQTENGTQIGVSSLPEGTYLLQIGTQVVRFIKK